METAVVVNVPEAEEHVRAWRRDHTADGADGMPAHITIIYPFADAAAYDPQMERDIASVLRGCGPIEFALSRTAYFGGQPNVLYLAPEPSEPFTEMTNLLVRRFPAYPPYAGAYDTVVPHLTVAVDDDLEVLAPIERDLEQVLPIDAVAVEAQLMAHSPAPDGWRLKRRFSLTGSR